MAVEGSKLRDGTCDAYRAHMSQPYEKLVAWQRADDLCIEIHKLTRSKFPNSERYELASQMRRAAYSVAANLVEGFASESTAMRLRYSRISRGSLAEVGYGVHPPRPTPLARLTRPIRPDPPDRPAPV